MTAIVLGILVLAAILLILVVMIQNPKGGGIAAGMGASSANQFLGVKKTGDLLENATWGLAGVVFLLSFTASVMKTDVSSDDAENDIDAAPKTNKMVDTTQAVEQVDTTK